MHHAQKITKGQQAGASFQNERRKPAQAFFLCGSRKMVSLVSAAGFS